MPRKYSDDYESKPKKLTRSVKLRKYASVYKSYVRKSEQSKTNKSPRCLRGHKHQPNKKTRARREPREEHNSNTSKQSHRQEKIKSLAISYKRATILDMYIYLGHKSE